MLTECVRSVPAMRLPVTVYVSHNACNAKGQVGCPQGIAPSVAEAPQNAVASSGQLVGNLESAGQGPALAKAIATHCGFLRDRFLDRGGNDSLCLKIHWNVTSVPSS